MTRGFTFAVPGDINTLTGGYVYDRRILEDLRAAGIAVGHCQLPGGFPFPTQAELWETRELLHAAAHPLLIDGLAFGALPEDLAASLPRRPTVLCHHPLGLEAGLSAGDSETLIGLEKAALRHARAIIVTSPTTAEKLVADFAVPAARLTVALPGTDPAPRATAYAGGIAMPGEVHLVTAGSIIPRKAYDVLVAALAGLQDMPWRLSLAGSSARAPATAAALVRQIEDAGLSHRIHLSGELARADLLALYGSADVFVMPSLYEGFGMVLTEAMACGLPLVASTGGAAAQTVPDACGLKVPPGDVGAMREALARVIADAPLRAQLAQASWEHGQTLARWSDTAGIIAKVLGMDMT